MTEIILCSRNTNKQELAREFGSQAECINGLSCSSSDRVSAFTPYVLGREFPVADKQIITQLSAPNVSNRLTNLSLTFGAENTVALAELTKRLQEFQVGVMGASTSVYANRIGDFVKAVRKYQEALMAYRAAATSGSSIKSFAKQKAISAFQDLQIRFRQELKAVNAASRARRGTPLSNATRATNIARSSRYATKLDVTSQVKAKELVHFTKHAKLLGNGLAVIDFSSRIGNIHNSYQSGGEWEREMFIESSSFALSAIAGTTVVNAGAAALGVLVVATPIGWVGVIVGGVAVAGVAAVTSIGVNKAIKQNSGSWYDGIMKVFGIR